MTYPVPSSSTALRPSTSSPADGSRTMTITADPTKQENKADGSEQGSNEGGTKVVRLRGARKAGPRVAWDDDVIDNEHLGKKKSKICCIYHKPRRFDESSDESSSSDSDSDSSCDGDGDGHHHRHHHRRRKPHTDSEEDESCDGGTGPNAYERHHQSKSTGKGKRKEV